MHHSGQEPGEGGDGQRKGLGLHGLATGLAGSAGNLLSRPPWELLGGHVAAVELPGGPLRDPVGVKADAAGALRVLGRAGVVRTWLRLDASGDASTLHLDKHGIAQRCGVPLRDLRVLEPGLTTSFSTALLCRERTMVINLEHVKMLVTAEEALIPNSDLLEVSAFAAALSKRLKQSAGNGPAIVHTHSVEELSKAAGEGVGGVPRAASAYALASQPPPLPARPSAVGGATPGGGGDDGLAADRDLPFEFRVLEKALEDVCGGLEAAAAEVEAEAHPALDKLTQKVSSHTLERVKRVKGAMTRVTGRVASVRGEIQRFLDDDSDMRDMYLSRKAAAAAAMAAPDAEPHLARGDSNAWAGHGAHASLMLGHGAPLDPMDDDADIQQLEDLLETYFAQIDHAFNKMKALDEYVGSTEDYINIDLDSHRNQLIQIDLLLSFAMFITSLFTLVTGVFGMNLNSGLAEDPHAFDEVTGISTALVVVGFAAFVYICRRQRLIQIF